MKKTLHITALLGVMALPAAPGASVSCQRDLVPGAVVEVYGPHGTSIRSGGGKTVISAELPGVRISR